MALPALGCLSSDAGGAAQASTVGAESAEWVSQRRQAVPALRGVRVGSECERTYVGGRPPGGRVDPRGRNPYAPLVYVPAASGKGPVRGARREHLRCARAAATDACVVPSASSCSG